MSVFGIDDAESADDPNDIRAYLAGDGAILFHERGTPKAWIRTEELVEVLQ